MATIRVPSLRRSTQRAIFVATPEAAVATDVDARCSDTKVGSMSYVWLCIFVGAALSVAIAVGVGFERVGVTEGTASWAVGAVAFGVALVPLMVTWALLQSVRG